MKTQDRLHLMGTKVVITQTFDRYCEGRARKYRRLPCSPRTGWIVGFRHIQEGTVDEPNTFTPTGTIPCVLVCCWPTETPVKVPHDAFVVAGDDAQPPAPLVAGYWTPKRLTQCSAISKQYDQRDAKGRFK